jgi:hypothetical protein
VGILIGFCFLYVYAPQIFRYLVDIFFSDSPSDGAARAVVQWRALPIQVRGDWILGPAAQRILGSEQKTAPANLRSLPREAQVARYILSRVIRVTSTDGARNGTRWRALVGSFRQRMATC